MSIVFKPVVSPLLTPSQIILSPIVPMERRPATYLTMSPSRLHVTRDFGEGRLPSPASFSGPEPWDFDMELDPRVYQVLIVSADQLSVSEAGQTWNTLCGCGGIGPHHHQSTMNGAGSGETIRRNGPLPNFVQVARSYVFEQDIQKSLRETGVSQAREDSIRLAGVQWIDNVRRALKL